MATAGPHGGPGWVGRLTCVIDTHPTPAPPPGAPVSAPVLVRVLVAEDQALIRLDLAEMLVEAGYDVVGQASNGEQAVTLSRELKPDLVIMDVKMPVLDGISAAEQIGKERIAPVVMLTAFSQKELVERARDAGVMAYLLKPFTSSDLAPAIGIARSRWVELQTLEAEVADLGERLETRKIVDRAKGVLMTELKISEPEAFSWLQKNAMNRRLGMREVAAAVVSGLTGGSPAASATPPPAG
jgi:two-component system, response regulator PdtaR